MTYFLIRARAECVSVLGVACLTFVGLSGISANAQVATTPGTPALPTPAPDLSNSPRPNIRTRSIKLPDAPDLPNETPVAVDLPPSGVTVPPPPTFPVTWHDPANRIAVYLAPNMRVQGEMFARVVLFLEMRNASKTEVIRQHELPSWFAKNGSSSDVVTAGNNLRANDLARFFNTARIQNEQLGAAEQRLLTGLIDKKILKRAGVGFEAAQPEPILVTAALPSSVNGCDACTVSEETHLAILTHELGHARFFIDPLYRDFARWFWAHGLNEAMRQAFTKLLKLRGYDENNPVLVADEMQAFLMHTPSSQLFSAAMLGVNPEQLGAARIAFTQGLRSLELPLLWDMPSSPGASLN